MSEDLEKRLRNAAPFNPDRALLVAAADRIRDVEAALRDVLPLLEHVDDSVPEDVLAPVELRARAALKGG